jgi:hypothetical protein
VSTYSRGVASDGIWTDARYGPLPTAGANPTGISPPTMTLRNAFGEDASRITKRVWPGRTSNPFGGDAIRKVGCAYTLAAKMPRSSDRVVNDRTVNWQPCLIALTGMVLRKGRLFNAIYAYLATTVDEEVLDSSTAGAQSKEIKRSRKVHRAGS